MANGMITEVMDEEIKNTLFCLGDNKAPGPDGFSAYFFKKAWDVVGKDVTMAIKDFFKEGFLGRIKSALPLFIDPAQAAFVGDRRIGDNILLCQQLVHNYNRASAKEKWCALKVDLMKAYDSVNWEFLLQVLKNFGFLSVLVNWISKCITTPRF
ncbi:uncharacterized protein LOC116144061 [Pistacia vera]|uniref:uncharacterized protein LOC116144061 n=1 Tax=Pistacia vera TaxID=55513 RepID=UPI001262E1F4|nr:uncharacterized protein LOC116144061 [Pistacia vera]